MVNLKELEKKYLELGKEIEALKKQNTEKEELEYPVYCKHKFSSQVVKFTSLTSGEVIVNNSRYKIGEIKDWISHTDTETWQQLDVCEETGFFDGQLVWCWQNNYTHKRDLKFYNVKNKCTYQFDGSKIGSYYHNYEPFEGNYPEWALEAFQTLERE